MIRLAAQSLFGISVWLCLHNVSAQDALPPSIEKRSEPTIRQAVDAIYFATPEGRQVLFPGNWSLTIADDFRRFLLRDQQTPVPSFILRSIFAAGTVVGNRVEVDVQIELATSTFQPVRIPLGFREGLLPSGDQTDKPPFLYSGPGSADITVESGQKIAIVFPQTQQAESEDSEKPEKPDINQQHTLSLLLWFPFQNGTEENRLTISFPQANSSQCLLEVPMSNIDASVTPGILLEQQENAEKQITILKIQGLHSDTKIVWGKRKIEIVDDRPVLIVKDAAIDVQLDAQSAVYEAVLPVNGATGSFDQLQIRLPQGCVLDREFTDKYASASDYSVGDVDESSIVTIQFPQKTAGPVSLHLKGTQHFEGDSPDFNRVLSGFEVLGAERQTGVLSVSVLPSEMKPHWESVRGVRRTDIGSSSVATSSSVPASNGGTQFDIISQPFRLNVQVIAPQTRINVKPEYRFHISKGWITMSVRLSYTVSGTKTEALHVQLSDSQWHCEFGVSSIVDTLSVGLDPSGLLTIPLSTPSEGTIEIDFQARRSIASEEQMRPLVIPMPKPRASWSDPALVAIVADKNVEVLPLDESSSSTSEQRIVGLTLQTRRTIPNHFRIEPTDSQQVPLYYRTTPADAAAEPAVFVADLTYHQQQVSASMQTDVHLSDDRKQVAQTISYYAPYTPVDRLYFLLPRALALSGDVQISLENRTLELRDTVSEAREIVPDNWVRQVIQLPEPMFRFQLTFQYPPPVFNVAADGVAPFSLPFVYPTEVQASNHLIRFFTPSGYRAELQNESRLLWESSRETSRPSSNATEMFRSTQSPMRIALFIYAPERSVSGTTIVERAWLQTWLTGDVRVDRAAYVLRSTDDSITLHLPPNVVQEQRMIVRVNQQQITLPNISPAGVLTLPISPEQQDQPIEISVDYRYPFDMSGIEVPIILPSFSKGTSVQYQFWQVILRENKHIIGYPAGWTLEYDWTWNGLFWWRVPSIRKSDIGFESDASAPEPAISESSQYVFSHLHPPEYVTLYIVKRSWIIFGSSSIALLVGLILIYVPQSRYAGSLFGLGVALVAALVYQPPLVLLVLQAAVFGVFLALGAGYVYRIFHRHKPWVSSVFPLLDDFTQHYTTPLPSSPTIHEVLMDDTATSNDIIEPSVVHNGQS